MDKEIKNKLERQITDAVEELVQELSPQDTARIVRRAIAEGINLVYEDIENDHEQFDSYANRIFRVYD